jgi:hypothetical protein
VKVYLECPLKLLTRCLAILIYNDEEHETAKKVVHKMVKRAVELEGTVTGEHGVGIVKRDYLNHELGESTVDAMRKVSSCCRDSIRSVPFLPVHLDQTGIRPALPAELRQNGTSDEAKVWRG